MNDACLSGLPTAQDLRAFQEADALHQLQSVLDAVPAMVAVITAERNYRYVNKHYESFFGLPSDTLVGRAVVEVVGADAAKVLHPYFQRALAGEIVHSEGWVPYAAPGPRYTRRVYAPSRRRDGSIDGIFTFIQDNTAQQEAAYALQESEALKTALIAGALDSIIALDEAGVVIEFNPTAERTFGLQRDAILGQSVSALLALADGSVIDPLPNGLGAPLPEAFRRIDAIRADGTRFPAEFTATDVTVAGRRLRTLYLRDISERQRFETELAAKAYRDVETGLPNQARILDEIADQLRRARACTVAVIELDRFANLHSSFGQEFAQEIMLSLVRSWGESLTGGEMLARVGDRTFGILFPLDCPPNQIEARLQTVVAANRTAVTPSGAEVFLTASIGIASAEAAATPPNELLRDAEIAASRAREGGGGRLVWFDRSMHERLLSQVRIEHDLRRALLLDDQLWVAYQPIIELVTGRLAGFEALVRWQHPERGPISPGAFVPIAEETGLIVGLGAWVLRRACMQIKQWQEEREPGTAQLFVSVNLSPRELEEPDFLDRLENSLTETGIDPAWLKLEVTESAVMQRPEVSLRVLRRLKEMGLRLSIDDFGTGYSSLSYLTKFPFDSIKIDKSFVGAVHDSEENRSMVRIINDLARLFGFDVIAEGIENEAHANLLRALACDYGQGYFFSRPMPAEQALALIKGATPWDKP